jgi:hypothetical protein
MVTSYLKMIPATVNVFGVWLVVPVAPCALTVEPPMTTIPSPLLAEQSAPCALTVELQETFTPRPPDPDRLA